MVATAIPKSQAQFYREFIMGRGAFDPKDFGVDMEQTAFMDLMVDEFSQVYRGALSLDEVLLRPREAARFCDDVRRKHHFFDVPDDIILRSIMIRRKNP